MRHIFILFIFISTISCDQTKDDAAIVKVNNRDLLKTVSVESEINQVIV